MPQTMTDSTGEEIEVYTADEVKTREEAALETYKQENPDKTDEITKLQDDLRVANENLAKVGDKDHNFGELRKQVENANKALDDYKQSVPELIKNAQKEVLEGVNKTHYDETISSLSSGDEDLQKKIELEYKRLSDPADTKEQITKKLTDAYVLATKPEDVGALNSAVISSGNSRRPNIKSGQKFSADEKQMAQTMAQSAGLGSLDEKDFQ